MNIMSVAIMRENLEGAGDRINKIIDQGGTISFDTAIALAAAMTEVIQGHAMVAVSEQQRAANLIELARLTEDTDLERRYIKQATKIVVGE